MTMEDDPLVLSADPLITLFGGVRPMAAKLGVPFTTVQGWKKRGVIPGGRRGQIEQAAAAHHLDVTGRLVLTSVARRGTEAEEPLPVHAVEDEKDITFPPSFTRPADQDDLSRHPIAQEARRTVPPRGDRMVNATWWAMSMLAAAVLVGLLAMGPGVSQLKDQEKRLEALQNELQQVDAQMQAVKSQNAVLSGLVPAEVKKQISSLQDRARTIEETVTDLGTQARALTEGMMGGSASTLQSRLATMEEQMKALASSAGAPELARFLVQIQQWQSTKEGQKIFVDIVQKLQGLVINTDPAAFGKKMDQAVKADPVLTQALSGLSADEVKAAVMLLSLTQMRQTLARDQASFDRDLATLKQLLGTQNKDLTAAIDRLAPHAKAGVLTPDGLSRAFRGLTGDIVAASLSGENVSVADKAAARIHDMIKIERAGRPLTGTATQQAVDLAQKQLDQGDIAAAIATLQELDGGAATKAAPFVQQAETTLLARQVQDMLTKTVSASLSVQPFMQQLQSVPRGALNVQALTKGLAESLGAGN